MPVAGVHICHENPGLLLDSACHDLTDHPEIAADFGHTGIRRGNFLPPYGKCSLIQQVTIFSEIHDFVQCRFGAVGERRLSILKNYLKTATYNSVDAVA